MSKTNLKPVANTRPAKLSRAEMMKFAADLVNDVCEDETIIDRLLLLAVHLMEHCHDWQYMDNLGTVLSQSLYGATIEWSTTVPSHGKETQRRLFPQEGGAR